MKSASARGPMGWFIPNRSVLSISSRVAMPSSNTMIALSRASRQREMQSVLISAKKNNKKTTLRRTSLMKGISNRLEMKPGPSRETVTSLPMAIANLVARSIVSLVPKDQQISAEGLQICGSPIKHTLGCLQSRNDLDQSHDLETGAVRAKYQPVKRNAKSRSERKE